MAARHSLDIPRLEKGECGMDIPRTTVDELKAMMDSGETVIVLDVRQPEAYAGSNKKIRGAVYLDPNNDVAIREFGRGLDRKAAIVAYCT